MTTESTALIDYDAEYAKIAQETNGALPPASGNFISSKGKMFQFPDGVARPTFDAVILDFVRVNSLMPPYNPNVYNPPKCWAIGRDEATLVPSSDSPQQQSNDCASCAMNQFGSATNGGRGKACTNAIRLAVAPPDATVDSEIWLLKVSPMALARWRGYVQMTDISVGPGGFCRVITQFGFDPNRDYPSVTFKTIRPIDNPAVILNLRKRAREVILVEPRRD